MITNIFKKKPGDFILMFAAGIFTAFCHYVFHGIEDLYLSGFVFVTATWGALIFVIFRTLIDAEYNEFKAEDENKGVTGD